MKQATAAAMRRIEELAVQRSIGGADEAVPAEDGEQG